jgi:hypothetical protein
MAMRKTVATIALGLALPAIASSSAVAAPVVDGHFPLEAETDTNSKIVEGPDGNIWLPAHNGVTETDVARVTPDGKVTDYKLEGIAFASGIAVGPEKKLWITATNKVASFSPSNPEGTVQVFNDAFIGSNDPIVAGPDGQMWVAATENVVHFSPTDPEAAKSISVNEMSPRDIDVSGGQLVIADAGLPRIVTMTTSGVEHDIPIGHEVAGKLEGASQGVAGTPGGLTGFSQPGVAPEQIGFTSLTGPAQAFDRDADPFGAAYGSDHAFWFALSGAGVGSPPGVQRLTASGESTFLGGFPEGFTARQIASGPGNTIWVTVEKPAVAWEVVRISGLEPPSAPSEEKKKAAAPETMIGKGTKGKVKTRRKRAKVRFAFSSTAAGAAFECALVKLPKGKRKKPPKPSFKACRSPKKLSLKPGRYRFSVRAVSGGVVDPTPATRAFRIVHIG